MARYCQKCGKELVKQRVVGYDRKTGDPIDEYSCPVYIREMKEVKKRREGLKDRIMNIYRSKENKNPWYKILFTGRSIKKTLMQITQEESRKCYVGTAFRTSIITGLDHGHDYEIEIKSVSKIKSEGTSEV